ncbi:MULTISPECIES: hypothetical protein [unclassified Pseudomonas]|uniref:hypothetical protein n=1 Tax=unclassified Pseudomonas TaxID=196821 RepID=UPI0030DDA821
MKILDRAHASNFTYNDLDEGLRKGLKSADPSVYSVLSSVSELYLKYHQRLDPVRGQVGLIYYGNAYPKTITGRIVEGLASKDRVSPSDFINANAGAATSICCTRYGFQGPTLVLTMPGHDVQAIARGLADYWLTTCQADYLFLVEAQTDSAEVLHVSTELLQRASAQFH